MSSRENKFMHKKPIALLCLTLAVLSGCVSQKHPKAEQVSSEPFQISSELIKRRLEPEPTKETNELEIVLNQFAYESNLMESDMLLSILMALESGEGTKAKQMIIAHLLVTVAFLPFYATEAPIPEEDRQAAEAFATKFLAYLVENKEQIDSKLSQVKKGLHGLRKILTDEASARELGELTRYLYGTEVLGKDAELPFVR